MKNREELKPGYYDCWVCGKRTKHDWYSGLTNQEFETYPLNTRLPPEQLLCVPCQERAEKELRGEWE